MSKLHWENFAGLMLQASTPRNGSYAVLNLGRLGRTGYGARYAPAHRKNATPEWIGLGEFQSLKEARRRCKSHFSGEAYIPCAPAPRGAGEEP